MSGLSYARAVDKGAVMVAQRSVIAIGLVLGGGVAVLGLLARGVDVLRAWPAAIPFAAASGGFAVWQIAAQTKAFRDSTNTMQVPARIEAPLAAPRKSGKRFKTAEDRAREGTSWPSSPLVVGSKWLWGSASLSFDRERLCVEEWRHTSLRSWLFGGKDDRANFKASWSEIYRVEFRDSNEHPELALYAWLQPDGQDGQWIFLCPLWRFNLPEWRRIAQHLSVFRSGRLNLQMPSRLWWLLHSQIVKAPLGLDDPRLARRR